MNSATCLRIAAICGFLAVSLGAFGAHGLKERLVQNQTLEYWHTAVQYHFWHALVLLALAARPSIATGVVVSFVLGIVVFSGSLYILALTKIKWLGAITPIGGVSLLVGWAWLFTHSFKSPVDSP